MGFYRYFVRGLIGAGFCVLAAGCGAADPESDEVTGVESQGEIVPGCKLPTIDACVLYSTTDLTGRCCLCNGHGHRMKRSLLDPNTFQCKG